ncbi:transglycosylase SLT domain-containing protein [Streptomyces cyaneofuscatus]|uniref:Transglycosylase SLT domain-containing protein n=1 Tax=Streptomyces cyaneofuscatus TaxID=66883 RepID=A0ABZ1ES19_9ACTN|nr:transglycosylase SLT domain-containing protein [Streptomyces cyaneofuscatus]WSB06908.1 transglycosylase SLT domain-containing protein [Streptomyces cyaneofuscatus]WSD49557.1 transglycosylase SLT domain-containing protein [Streptomyces cyaneofuscatus]WSI47274.1 transglycosylase SLT domain-containing protein [Streptomyces cyaneofuscatus]WTA92981.1 transglycosylase SLT domain-containing protein [Streptomyces cyaneofuscatus]WTF38675.1 transglycosylase SLT domain-containing protein [Streptomyces
MSATRIPSRVRRLNKVQKISVAGVSALAVASLTFSLVPSNAEAEVAPQAAGAAAPVAFTGGSAQAKTVQDSLIEQHSTAEQLVKAADAAKAKAAAETKAKAAKAKAAADAKDKAEKAAKAKADAKKRGTEAANRSTARKPVYANNLDGWIREAMAIMKKEGIPGSYEGIHRNIIRESSGNRWAINNWDINARNGIPSKGLLQVIQPTFDRYHVKGTKKDLYDPVANIVAACNYAADRYGTMDNVDSAY